MSRTWRDDCRPIIREVLERTKGLTEREILKALSDAYPYGERKRHPYKIWLNEIKVQRGLIRSKTFKNPDQMKLF